MESYLNKVAEVKREAEIYGLIEYLRCNSELDYGAVDESEYPVFLELLETAKSEALKHGLTLEIEVSQSVWFVNPETGEKTFDVTLYAKIS